MLRDGGTVLATQAEQAQAIRTALRGLDDLTQVVATHDGDVRTLPTTTPGTAAQGDGSLGPGAYPQATPAPQQVEPAPDTTYQTSGTQPIVAASPAPSATPEPTPEPTPDPEPSPTPDPTPSPAPTPDAQ